MLDTTASSITYNGNGATTSFDYPFKIFAATEIEVWLTDAAGAETQINSDNFTVSGAGDDAGGSVLYPVAGNPVATGEKLTLRRILAVKQDFFDPSNNTAFQAEVLEDSADKTLAIIQQVKTDVDRSLRGSLTSSIDPELPEAEAGKVLAWNAAADAIVNLGVSAVIPASSINTVDITDDAITPAKVAAAVAGDGLAQAVGGALDVNVDDATLETSGDAVQIKPGGSVISVSANDSTPGVLNGKLVAGNNIKLTEGADGADETLTIASGFKGALVFRDSDQVIANATGADIIWTDESDDTDGFSDISEAGPNPNRLTVPANVSRVRLKVHLVYNCPSTGTTNGDIDVGIKKNGATYEGMPDVMKYNQILVANQSDTMQFETPVLSVSQNDYFTVDVFWTDQAGTAGLEFTGNVTGTRVWFAIEVIE